ncbi:MAG: ATP-binding protein [Opitutaceae bacterium]
MNLLRSSLPVTYQDVLRDYLARPDEENLQQAYELGRAALSAGLGVFDMIRLHHQALAEGLLPGGPLAPALEAFLLEVLSPFEAAHRGFRVALERLEELNAELGERAEALEASNARLQGEVSVRQRAEESLRELSGRILTAQEEERGRISRELHDEVGQALTAVNVAVAMLKRQAGRDRDFLRKVAEAEALLAQSMETVHAFARELRPAMLDHLGAHAALRAHVATYARRTGIRTELIAHPDLARLGRQGAEVVFRVAQEALSNVFKHAHATRVRIEFASDGRALTMEVADNGRAFPPAAAAAGRQAGRLGLVGMRERVRLVDGRFSIDSVSGRGTTVRIVVPLDPAPRAAAPAGISEPGGGAQTPARTHSSHEENIRLAS